MSDEATRKHASKIPEIIELRKEGKTWTEIAKLKDIPRRSLYNLRNSEGFMHVANDMWLDLMEDLKFQREKSKGVNGGAYNLNESIKNQIRVFTLLSGTNLDNLQRPKRIDPDPEICRQCILSKRKDTSRLLEEILSLISPEKHGQFHDLMTNFVQTESPYTRAAERLKE